MLDFLRHGRRQAALARGPTAARWGDEFLLSAVPPYGTMCWSAAANYLTALLLEEAFQAGWLLW